MKYEKTRPFRRTSQPSTFSYGPALPDFMFHFFCFIMCFGPVPVIFCQAIVDASGLGSSSANAVFCLSTNTQVVLISELIPFLNSFHLPQLPALAAII